MATPNSPAEIKLPTSDSSIRQSADLLPRFFRTDDNKKFLQSTIDQLTQPGTVKKVNGYIGRQTSKSVKSSDVYVDAVSSERRAYQLEPAAVIQDDLGNTLFLKDYIDHINHIGVSGGNISNHEPINRQEFYSWNPHICWDKISNFQEYYWLPDGPATIEIPEVSSIVEFVGQPSFVSSGVSISNGMKVSFPSLTDGSKYSSGDWYVEGVGDAITLSLAVSEPLTLTGSTQDYVVINRNSPDRNSWSQANRWFHKDVIIASAAANGLSSTLDQSTRAARPIIEFLPGIKLSNSGIRPKVSVDVVDTVTSDAFGSINGSFGYNIDGIDLADGMRILVTADTDSLVNNRVYKVRFSNSGVYPRIVLDLESDSDPVESEVVFVRYGVNFAKASFWFNGTTWVRGQQKTSINQSPLFDVVDSNKVSFADYESSTFKGTKIFSYKLGNGVADSVLGFPVAYQNINNIGDITFLFDYQNDQFSYNAGTIVKQQAIDSGFFIVYDDQFSLKYENGWVKSSVANTQPVVRVFKESGFTNNFPVDVFDNAHLLDDLQVNAFVNGNQLKASAYELTLDVQQVVVTLVSPVSATDIVTLECYSRADKTENGYYKIPINLQQNPLNENLVEFTLGQVSEHATSIVRNTSQFVGEFPGNSNLRDLPQNIVTRGTKIVQHSSPLNFSLYHFGKDSANIMKALNFAKVNYATFKRAFINAASVSGIDASARQHVDFILAQLSDGRPKTSPYYLSDMFASHGGLASHYVSTSGQVFFSLTSPVVTGVPSNSAVLVYVNEVIALLGRDYVFSDNGTSIEFLVPLAGSTQVDIYEFNSTDGSFCPPTPTKLGIFPKYQPLKFVDDTYSPEFLNYEITDASPTSFVVQRHGGFYNAAHVTVILETRTSDLQTISREAMQLGTDFTVAENIDDTLTIEFLDPLPEFSLLSIGVPPIVIQGHDGSIIIAFNDYRDELVLELESRIYNNLKVEYDPAILDISTLLPGYSRLADIDLSRFNEIISPMFYSWLAAGVNADYTEYRGYDELNRKSYNLQDFYTVDGKSVPGFWRGVYKFLFDTDRPHICPWECLGESVKPDWWNATYGPSPYTSDNLVLWDDIRTGTLRLPSGPIVRTQFARPVLGLQAPVDQAGNLISPIDTQYITGTVRATGRWEFGDMAPVEAAWRRSSDFCFSLLQAMLLIAPSRMFGAFFDRSRIKRNLAGQIIYTDTGTRIRLNNLLVPSTVTDTTRVYTSGLVNYIVDYISSNSHNNVADYKYDLSSLTNKLSSKLAGFTSKSKFKVMLDSKSPTSGETKFIPEENFGITLNTSSPIRSVVYSGMIITLHETGYEISGYNSDFPYFSYYKWNQSGETITAGGISEIYSEWQPGETYVAGKVVFYAGKYYRTNVTHQSTQFNSSNFTMLAKLPISGGQSAILRTSWNKNDVRTLAYSTKLSSVQEVVDLLQGYSEYLIDQGFEFDQFNQGTTSVSNWITSINDFLFWTTQSWPVGSVLSISPAASKLVLKTEKAVVQDIFNPAFGYKIFRVDGNSLNANYLSVYRGINEFAITSTGDTHGIYGATFYLVQKEHVLTLDSRTMFNDVVYDLATGYKQDRLRVIGYTSRDWTGGFNIPGFIFDDAVITQWSSWTDYHNGDIVKYKEYYYSAPAFVVGSEEFNSAEWVKLAEKPVSQLIPNWDYKANQFLDFYELDSSNFDVEQQKIAQHLIGYQPRSYLQDIINDDVSQYKFYQGMIVEKGTQNVLSKLFDVVSAGNADSVGFVEEWAVRTGKFGAVDIFKDIDLRLDESKFTVNPQPIEVYTQLSAINDQTYQVPITKVYNQTQQSQLFTAPLADTNVLRTPGLLTYTDVDLHIDQLTDLVGTSTSLVNPGDKVWCGFEGRDWNVYVCKQLDTAVTEASYVYNQVTLHASNSSQVTVTSTSGSTVTVPRGVSGFTVHVIRPNLPVGTAGDGDFTGFELGQTTFENDTTTFDSKFKYSVQVTETMFTTAGALSVHDVSDTVSEVMFDDYLTVPRTFTIDIIKVNKETNESETISGNDIEVTFSQPTFIPGDVIGITSHELLQGFSKVVAATRDSVTIEKVVSNWEDPFIPGSIKLLAFFIITDRYELNVSKLTPRPDPSLITEAYLYNVDTNNIVAKLDVVDVVTGKIPAIANSEIRYKGYTDPASYSVGESSLPVSIDAGQAWGTGQVGLVWWDLTRARFLENQLGATPSERAVLWNRLYSTASIDICEWVSSRFSPDEWNSISGTARGDALGISGTAKYGNAAYSIETTTDSVSGAEFNTYYFWVVNKTSAPNVLGRTLSCAEISQLISDPVSYGYQCLAVLGNNSVALANVNRLVSGESTSLRIRYRTTKVQETPVHSEWKIISEDPSTVLPATIENKWFDSLIGVDSSGQPIPHPALPDNLKYGVNNSPAQSMFVNRVEALKQVVGSVNLTMKGMLVSDLYDLQMLETSEQAPSQATPCEWDVAVDTNSDLSNIRTRMLTTAVLQPVIVGGKVVSVTISNPGLGYVTAPTLEVDGIGTDSEISLAINESGEVISAIVVSEGSGYNEYTAVTVRPFTVLVRSDSEFYNKWSIRSWNPSKLSWDVVKVQSHDVTKFWNYVDWFAPDYDQYLKSEYIVDNVFQLLSTEIPVGKLVKVQHFATGGWAVFKKTVTNPIAEYSPDNYEIVARQRGTIQFSPDLYETDTVSSRFDELFFDQFLFDNYPINEIRIILNFIKQELLTGELYGEYLKLFFSSIRYVLNEQLYADWVFKTSFVKVIHYAGQLTQPATFNPVPVSSFEDYINEVKPYRTKIRTYTSSYSTNENSGVAASDFDLPPIVAGDLSTSAVTVAVSSTGVISSTSDAIDYAPWKNWKDNFGYIIDSIEVLDGGTNYLAAPEVVVSIGGATATATVSGGRVVSIELTSPGLPVRVRPQISFSGDNQSAVARAVLANGVVRSNSVGIKFDRLSRTPVLDSILVHETSAINPGLVGDGVTLQFSLMFSPDARFVHGELSYPKVTIDGIELSTTEFSLSSVVTSSDESVQYTGSLSFVTPPVNGSTIEVWYIKSSVHLSATDRINFYYTPGIGQLGKGPSSSPDYSQLMTGVDYGGNIVTGSGFISSSTWGTNVWDAPGSMWDDSEELISDSVVVTSDAVRSYLLSSVPEVGVKIHVIINGDRVDYDPEYEPVDPLKMPIFVGDGVTNEVIIPANITIIAGDTIVFEQEPSANSIDSIVSAGDLTNVLGAYSTATGLTPSEIAIDGAGLITPATSYAPEEVVPGQIVDTLAISVFTTNAERTQVLHGFMQFKDMLNRVQYKRLRAAKATVLSEPLLQTDSEIVVDDGTILSVPTPQDPGVIMINGERIEYRSLALVGAGPQAILSTLRRATLGTGMLDENPTGSRVVDISSSETVPYVDQEVSSRTVVPFGTCRTRTSGFQQQLVITSEYSGRLTVGSIIDINNVTVNPAVVITARLVSWVENIGTDRVYITDVTLPEILEDVDFSGQANSTVSTSDMFNGLSPSDITDSGINVFNVFDGGFRLKKQNYIKSDSDGRTIVIPGTTTPVEFSDYVLSEDALNVELTEPSKNKLLLTKRVGQIWNGDNLTLENSTSDAAMFIKSNESYFPYP